MPYSARTAPGVGSARSPHRIAALPAVLVLVVLAALGIAAPAPGTAGAGVPAAPAAAAPQRYDETRAGDGCDAVRAAIRHEQHSEHPGPRGHFGVCGRSADVAPGGVPGPPQVPSRHLPCSQPPADQEQGRAPPVSSGT
ncbi:hypothetical protein RFN58_01240 [Streptomyces iakyrus]|uniref:hypothetical protein n=1 Tax=Streptomyces iakyrus TaxID=68219 RepID=UPI0005262DBD|nr:hypothetical protein [Streptomyces iakyrus]